MPHALADLSWPIATPRTALRPATEADFDAIHRYRAQADVSWWMGGHPGTREELQGWLGRPERLARTLALEHDGAVVGDLMLKVQDGWAQTACAEQAAGVEAELGWCLDPAYGGRGLATEAVAALLAISFDDLGLRRVTAGCFLANASSWRLMERVGMRREQVGLRDSLHCELGWLDGCTYGLLAEEWRTRVSQTASEA